MMRIEQNVITGNIQVASSGKKIPVNVRDRGNGGKAGKQQGKQSVDGTGLNLMQDDILQRKEKARRDAMDIIGKQFAADGRIDDDIEERRERIAEKKALAEDALKEVNALKEQQEKLKETYRGQEDSPEYQDALGELSKKKGNWQKEIEQANRDTAKESQIIRATEQEMLKYHGMEDAAKAAEETMQAASQEIMGMLIQDGMEHVQDEVKEAEEKGQKIKEEKEELEALREEKKAEREEQEQKLLDLSELSGVQQEVEEKIQEILEKQKLLEEDLKGVQVNRVV